MKELIERLRDDRLGMLQGLGAEAADALERMVAEQSFDDLILAAANETVASLTAERDALHADRDSWRQQCSDRVADAARFIDERDAWEKNCNDQIDLLNFTANVRDAAESACQILALEVGELQKECDAMAARVVELTAELALSRVGATITAGTEA